MRLPRKYKKECKKEALIIGYLPVLGYNPIIGCEKTMTKKVWDLYRYINHGSNFKINS